MPDPVLNAARLAWKHGFLVGICTGVAGASLIRIVLDFMLH
jgi:hypothetical protein